MKTILLIGSGAREHAMARAIKRSQRKTSIICLASHLNPGIAMIAEEVHVISLTNIDAIKQKIKGQSIDFAIIGPEAPLEAGIVDSLKQLDIPAIGPTKSLARIESSKSFCRDLLQKYESSALPVFKTFKSLHGLDAFLHTLGGNYVIKASGLMGGKGVFVSDEHFQGDKEAMVICEKLLSKKRGILIEEKLVGEEFSLLSFCDGKTLKHMPIVQDNKRAYFNDKGPNTGGMGSVSYADHSLPFLTPDEIQRAQRINERATEGLKEECREAYKGILYGGYMLTKEGVKLIEFNARFGDPECVNLLALLETDFVDICEAILAGSLDELSIQFSNKASVCKYVVPQGYPHMPVKNQPIHFDVTNMDTYCAHVESRDDTFTMLGSRAIAALGVGNDIHHAEESSESVARSVKGSVFYRNDIGKASLLTKRIERMKALREETT